MKTIVCSLLLAAFLLSTPSPLHAYAWLRHNGCAGEKRVKVYAGFVGLRPKCGTLSGAPLAWADEAFAEWIISGSFGAPWVMIDGPCTTANPGVMDGIRVAARGPVPDEAFTAPFLTCSGGGNATTLQPDIFVTSEYDDLPPHCSTGNVTENGTWLHEAGHVYGWDHFDDWLSTMNTFTPDITSCRPDRYARPSSDAQQGQALWYGWPAAVDVGVSPIVQNGPLLGGGSGALLPASYYVVANGASSFQFTVKYTHMNMRNAWPNSTHQVAFYLSNDAIFDSSDTLLNVRNIGGTFAGAIYPHDTLVTIVPQTQLPVGVSRCIIIRTDPNNLVAEKDENDNATDTQFCFLRLPA